MKYLQSYNESLRDKMTGKTPEEITATPSEILSQAYNKGDINLLELSIDMGMDINQALTFCVGHQFYYGVRWCLENGATNYGQAKYLAKINGTSILSDMIQSFKDKNTKS